MTTYGLAIAWNWEYDADFVAGIERACAVRGVTTFRVDPGNLHDVLHDLRAGRLAFELFFDRASDADPAFLPLAEACRASCRRVFNPHDRVARAVDKSVMHLVLQEHGLTVPRSLILPPYAQRELPGCTESDLLSLGVPFVIKPANTTGGGTGVVLGAGTLDEVRRARTEHPHDSYLVQETVHPAMLAHRRAWFRAYAVFGETILCWWDDQTHLYEELQPEEEERYDLGPLRAIVTAVQNASGLDFFSSEVARTADGRFVVVDYVNEVCDMRLQSRHGNGAPDAVVHRVEELLAAEAASVLSVFHEVAR